MEQSQIEKKFVPKGAMVFFYFARFALPGNMAWNLFFNAQQNLNFYR